MERQQEIAATVTEETGGTFGWGMFNVELAAGMLAVQRRAGGRARLDEPIQSHIPGKEAKAVRQAVGVVVGIAPWNAPVILAHARDRRPARLRQHRRPEGVRGVPAHARGDRQARWPTRARRRASST